MVYTFACSLRYELSLLASNVDSFPSIVFYRTDVETFLNEMKNSLLSKYIIRTLE